MNQYQNQYGTVYAVRDYKGAPQIMCRAKDDGDWLVSGTLAVQAAAAKTADEMQAVLDQHATAHGWQPVDEQAPASAEPQEIVDEGSGPEDGFPDWVRPMVEAFLRFPFFRELPAFTAFAIRHSEPVQHRQGGSLADGLYDTVSKGIKFSVFRGNNSDHYREASYTWADFVRRCKAAGLAPEQLHQDKEDAPCNTETPAQTGAAAATTDGRAVPEPSQAAETTTTSESGADADTSMSLESGTSGPSTSPARGCPAGTGDAASGAKPAASPVTTPSSLPAFDYTGLDAQTVQDLHLAEREVSTGKRLAEIGLRRMADGVAIAHDALCGTDATFCRNGDGTFTAPEKTFGRWCDSVGLNRKAAERLLQVSKLFDNSTPREEKVLEELGPSLLYAAAKPSAPAELVQAVKDGDITTHKQYQDLLARYNAEKSARQQAEQERDEAATHIQAARDMQIDTARERDAALHRAAEAEKQRDGAREAARAAEAENDEMRRKLQQAETRPIEVAVAQPGEAQIEAWRQEGADRCAAALQDAVQKAHKGMVEAQNHAADLEDQLAQARPDADACQRTVDTIFETIESLRGLLRTQLRAAQLTPAVYGGVVGHLLQVAQNLQNTVRDCAPAGYTMNDDEEDFL